MKTQPADRNSAEIEAWQTDDVQDVQEVEKGEGEAERERSAPQTAAPGSHLLLSEPAAPFPVKALAAFVQSPRFQDFDVWLSEGGEHLWIAMARNPRLRGPCSGLYQFQVGRYNVLAVTPVLEWYLGERDAIQKIRRQAIQQGEVQGASDPHQLRWDWSKYEGTIRSVVRFLAIPDFGQTTASWLLSGITEGVTQLKYKTSFSGMSLLCDGKEILPIDNKKFQVELPDGYGTPEGAVAFAGAYEYSFEDLARNRCRKLELRIVSEGKAGTEAKAVPGKIVQQV